MHLPPQIDIKKALGITAALGISGLMILGAYVFSGPSFFAIQTVDAEDTKKLLEAFAVKDTDADGLPDWQEALYDTNPQNAHSVSPTMTDGEAVAKGLVKPKFESAPIATTTDISTIPGVVAPADTLTDEFSKTLFQQYIQSTGATAATPEQIAGFVSGAMGQLNTMYVAPTGFRNSDVRVAGTGTEALRTYAIASQNVFFTNVPSTTKDETSYLYDALTQDDTTAPAKIAKIGAWYTATGKAYMKVSVPSEAAAAHLRYANALIQIGSITTDLSTINTDPLRALLGIGHYDAALKELLDAGAALNQVFVSANVSFTAGTSGAAFLNMLQSKTQ